MEIYVDKVLKIIYIIIKDYNRNIKVKQKNRGDHQSEKMEEESDIQLGSVYFSAADIDLLCDFSLRADVWASDRV